MKTTEELAEIQMRLSRGLILEDRFREPIERISGVDLAFAGDVAVVACVTLDYPSLKAIEEKTTQATLDFPYQPGYLWFREGPAILKVIKSMDVEPDVFMINAHGIAHPRRFGCASHFGVETRKPTIGVAGSKLCGECERPPTRFGEREPLKMNGEVVGWVIKPAGGRPIYVSPGHMVSVESAARIVIDCLRNHRFPEPIYLSHRLANSRRREF